jgi:hypothetical protein
VIFRELHALRGQGKFVFPAVDSVRRCMSNNTLNAALRRLGYANEEVGVGYLFKTSHRGCRVD